jgi:hypothetical protein
VFPVSWDRNESARHTGVSRNDGICSVGLPALGRGGAVVHQKSPFHERYRLRPGMWISWPDTPSVRRSWYSRSKRFLRHAQRLTFQRSARLRRRRRWRSRAWLVLAAAREHRGDAVLPAHEAAGDVHRPVRRDIPFPAQRELVGRHLEQRLVEFASFSPRTRVRPAFSQWPLPGLPSCPAPRSRR